MSNDGDRRAPALRDSDLMYLAVKRLEAIADKMAKHEYDDALDAMMLEAADLFGWAAHNIAGRKPFDRHKIGIDRVALNDQLTPIWNAHGLEGEEYDDALNDLTHEVADRIEREIARVSETKE